MPTLGAPRRNSRRRRTQYPVRELVNEARFFGDVNELGCRSDTAIGFAPAKQRLQPRYFKGMQRDLRLKHEHQVAGFDSFAQRLFEAEALGRRVVQRGPVQCETVAAQLL